LKAQNIPKCPSNTKKYDAVVFGQSTSTTCRYHGNIFARAFSVLLIHLTGPGSFVFLLSYLILNPESFTPIHTFTEAIPATIYEFYAGLNGFNTGSPNKHRPNYYTS